MSHSDENQDEPISEEEGFEYSYRNFLEIVEILAKEPADQVVSKGNYNVAFELVYFATAGIYVADSSVSYLTGEQEHAIRAFLRVIDLLPFREHSGREERAEARFASNLADMLHPIWNPIRPLARELVAQLASATELNNAYFDSLGPSPSDS